MFTSHAAHPDAPAMAHAVPAADAPGTLQQLNALLKLSPEPTLVCRRGRIVFANRAAIQLLGSVVPDSIEQKPVSDYVDTPHHAPFQTSAETLACGDTQEQTWIRTDGSRFDAEVTLSCIDLDDGPVLQVGVRDVSARKRAEALRTGENRVLHLIATGAGLPDILGEIATFVEHHANRGLCSILLLDSCGTKLEQRAAPSLPEGYVQRLGPTTIGPSNGSCGTAVFRREPVLVTDIASDPLWADRRGVALEFGLRACTSWPIFGHRGQVLGSFALYFREPVAPEPADLELFCAFTRLAGIAIERHAEESRVRRLAHYDGLTGLPNRFLFNEFLTCALRSAQRRNRQCAVLFVDLDRFKQVNDSLGHEAGDRVLRELAQRMRACLRESDKIARMGGDEFYVLIEDLQDGRHAKEVAHKLIDAAARPISIDGATCTLGASVGIAVFPQDGRESDALLAKADSAMYKAKHAGRNTYCFHRAAPAHTPAVLAG